MRAVLQFYSLARVVASQQAARIALRNGTNDTVSALAPRAPSPPQSRPPVNTVAFYRKHTEKLLRGYLYASMLIGRAPSILSQPLVRGFTSCRRVETFEDSVLFVLDMEKCLNQLPRLDREVLSRIVIQEYTPSETALLLNRSERAICARFRRALDELTQILLDAGILRVPR